MSLIEGGSAFQRIVSTYYSYISVNEITVNKCTYIYISCIFISAFVCTWKSDIHTLSFWQMEFKRWTGIGKPQRIYIKAITSSINMFFLSHCTLNDRSIFGWTSVRLLWACILVPSISTTRYVIYNIHLISACLFTLMISIQNISSRHFNRCIGMDNVNLDICWCFYGCL